MNAKELREKDSKELEGELVELRKEQFNLRMQAATGQLGNPARMKEVRRDIARVKTVMREQVRSTA